MKIIFKNLKFICTILNCNYINIYEGIRKKYNESTHINILIIYYYISNLVNLLLYIMINNESSIKNKRKINK